MLEITLKGQKTSERKKLGDGDIVETINSINGNGLTMLQICKRIDGDRGSHQRLLEIINENSASKIQDDTTTKTKCGEILKSKDGT